MESINAIIKPDSVYKTEKGTPVTDSVRVAGAFGKKHKNVLQAIRNLIGSAENSAAKQWFYESVYCDAQGKRQPMFVMNRDGFTLLAMGLTGERAMMFKVAFIEQFNRMESVLKQMAAQTPAIPQTFAEALRLAAHQAEEIEKQQRQIADQRTRLEEQAPKVLFAQSVEAASNSILIRDLAKILKQNGVEIGGTRLFHWLRSNGFLCKNDRDNRPTQKAMEMGLFEIKETAITKPNGDVFLSSTTKVTGKGQIYFINKFLYQKSNQ